MKIEFKLLMSGEDSLKKKFHETLEKNPNLHMDLIRSFGQAVMLALRLDESDKIVIDGFRAGEVRNETIPLENSQKEVAE